eukprot:gene2512-3137_t
MVDGAVAGQDGSPQKVEKAKKEEPEAPGLGVTKAGKPRKQERMTEANARDRMKQKRHLWKISGGPRRPPRAPGSRGGRVMQNFARDECVGGERGVVKLYDNFAPHFNDAADNGQKARGGPPNGTAYWQSDDELILYIRIELRTKTRPRYFTEIIRLAKAFKHLMKIPHPTLSWFAEQLQEVAVKLNTDLILDGRYKGMNVVQRAWAMCGLGPLAKEKPELMKQSLRDVLAVRIPAETVRELRAARVERQRRAAERAAEKAAKEGRAAEEGRLSTPRPPAAAAAAAAAPDAAEGAAPPAKRRRAPGALGPKNIAAAKAPAQAAAKAAMPPPPRAVDEAALGDEELSCFDLDDVDDDDVDGQLAAQLLAEVRGDGQ